MRKGAVSAGPPRPLVFNSRRLVLFDLDDTLCDYSSARERRLRTAFSGGDDPTAHAPLNLDLERMVAVSIALNPHGVDHFSRLFADLGIADPGCAERAAGWYQRNRFFGLDLFPEALRVIAWLRSTRGWSSRIGVVTNGPAEIQREKVILLGVDRLADFVLVSEEFGSEKPGRAIFPQALRLGGATAGEAIMVGDSLEHDIAGARAVEIASVWINRFGRTILPTEPVPDFIVQRLKELPCLPRLAGSHGDRC